MQKMKRAKGFLCCWFICVGITLFFVAPAIAGWTTPALDSNLILDTEVSVLGPDPACITTPGECIPGLVELPVFNESGDQQQQIDVNDIVRIKATLVITPEMPLPIQIRIIFGGLGYQTAPREWTLRNPGTYSNSAYFMVSSDGVKTIGVKAWVKDTTKAISTNTILDTVVVGP
jgi:hypothetical protein